MNARLVSLGVVFTLIYLTACSTYKSGTTISDKNQWIQQKVDSGRFKIEVNNAYPLSGRMINLTSIYTLEVRNDSVFSYLPYFGRAYVAPIDPMRGGLTFDLPISNYIKKYSPKKGYQITFDAKDLEDNYKFSVGISPDGYSDIAVTTYKRSFIRFTGVMVK